MSVIEQADRAKRWIVSVVSGTALLEAAAVDALSVLLGPFSQPAAVAWDSQLRTFALSVRGRRSVLGDDTSCKPRRTETYGWWWWWW